MKVITLASLKGGTGKTTLSSHLAVAATVGWSGPVCVVEMDSLGPINDWSARRGTNAPLYAFSTADSLPGDLADLRQAGTNLVFIDVPPAQPSLLTAVLAHSDFVLIPVRQSPHDLRSAGVTASLTEEAGKPYCFVVNDVLKQSGMHDDGVLALAQHGTVSPAMIDYDENFAASMIDGRTVMEITDAGDAESDIMDLWAYIEERLDMTGRPSAEIIPFASHPKAAQKQRPLQQTDWSA